MSDTLGIGLSEDMFSEDPSRREALAETHRSVLEAFNGQIPDLQEYVTGIRSQLMDEERGFDEAELGYAGVREALARRIASLKNIRGLSHPADMRELLAYTVEVHRAIFSLGPLHDLMDDPDVTDIMIHAWDRISVARRTTGDSISMTGLSFASEENLITLMQNQMSANKKSINPQSPIASGVMPGYGARIEVIDRSITDGSMAAIIRKPSDIAFTPADLIRLDSFPVEVGTFLGLGVRAEMNMVVVGATGSGKTALLSALMHHIPQDAHTVTIEDTIEIQPPPGYKIITRYRTRENPDNPDDPSNVSIYRLLKAALRSNPTYIFVGETRGEEAWEMLQAMKSGHAGITTVHAGDGPDALTRLEGMMSLAANAADADYLRRDIAEVMHLFVIQGWVGLGKRHRRGIKAIYEIVPTLRAEDLTLDDLVPESSAITAEGLLANNPQYVRQLGSATLRTLYVFDLEKDRLVPGVLPSQGFLDRLAEHGLLDEYLKIRTL